MTLHAILCRASAAAMAVGALGLAVAAPAAAQDFKPVIAGGWAVAAEKVNGKFTRCTADSTGNGNQGLRFSFMANLDRYLSLPGSGAPVGSRDQLSVQLKPSGKVLQLPMVQRGGNRLWTAKPLSNDEFEGFYNAKQMDAKLASQNAIRTFRLGDVGTMGDAIDGCLSTFVGGGAAPPPPPPPAPSRQQTQYPVESDAHRMGAGCPQLGQYKSPPSTARTTIEFTGQVDHAVTVYWIDFKGNPVDYGGLVGNNKLKFDTFLGHYWIAKDFDGRCYGGVMQARAGANRIVVRP
jgi:hypothetical protein